MNNLYPNQVGLEEGHKNVTSKRGIVSDYLPWSLIAVAMLVILTVTIFILKGKGISALDLIKNLFRGK